MVLIPAVDIERVSNAHRRFLGAIEDLTDEQVRGPSLLPGWTVGHVLSHVARNADSHVRRAEAAARGEMVDQYDGGHDARNRDIETGSARSAIEIVEDVRTSALAVEGSWSALPVEAWTSRTRDANGRERPLFELPSRRWQEVEVHLIDIDVGVSHRDWPDEFVLEWLPRTRERMQGVLPAEFIGLRFDVPADELAWLYGRLHRHDLPELPPWG